MELEEPTSYEIECKASVAAWEEIRPSILQAVTESHAMQIDQECLDCDKSATLRCSGCGPVAFYCEGCFSDLHKSQNTFHIAEKWEKDHFVPFIFERCVNVRPSHQCLTQKQVPMKCIDDQGFEHKLLFVCCECEPLPLTLVRAHLWPASPQHPRYAFTFTLLDWAEALLLECQVALKDFCTALYFKCPFKQSNKREMYHCLIDSFEEYRYMKHELCHMNYLVGDLDPGNVCPACPLPNLEEPETVVYSMDALFGLPRKKSAGSSHRKSLHGHLHFLNQSDVDQFVKEAQRDKPVTNDCSDFLAGNIMRSAVRYKSLDETAVFGYACRHEFPGQFLNLKHGERLAYGVKMLETIIEARKKNVYVMYDIACTMQKHLQSLHRTDILSCVHLCLPTFHCYGHKVPCQVIFGPRRCVGLGLSDGEGMERLWSYMRRFGRMTKEMRPSHREDILTHALLYYGMRTKKKLAELLLLRWERACHTKEVAEETISHLMPGIDWVVAEDAAKLWLSEENKSCDMPTENFDHWQYKYIVTLELYETLRKQLACDNDLSELKKLDGNLKDMERKHNLQYRWSPSNEEFLEYKSHLQQIKKKHLLSSVWAASTRRRFLLKLKAKYADGQKIAKKLSQQICKETNAVKVFLQEHNSYCNEPCEELSLSDVLDPSTRFRNFRQYEY